MPEFQLDHGSKDGHRKFMALDYFTRGYVEAMFFTECSSDNKELENATVDDIADETWLKIISDCAEFQKDNEQLLNQAYEITGDYDAENAGRDFWYTRNGHGVGYWDRGLGVTGEALSKTARHREIDLVRGDDGKLYL